MITFQVTGEQRVCIHCLIVLSKFTMSSSSYSSVLPQIHHQHQVQELAFYTRVHFEPRFQQHVVCQASY